MGVIIFYNLILIYIGALSDSQVIDGIIFERTFVYAGNELQPKSINHPKILLLNHEVIVSFFSSHSNFS